VVVGVPALGVGELEPAHEVGEVGGLVLAGPEDEVEVAGHEDVGEDAHGEAGVGLFEGAFEGGVIGGFLEDAVAGGGEVEDVVSGVAADCAGFAGHDGQDSGWGWMRSIKMTPDPFSFVYSSG